jgi:hypothetical protein
MLSNVGDFHVGTQLLIKTLRICKPVNVVSTNLVLLAHLQFLFLFPF